MVLFTWSMSIGFIILESYYAAIAYNDDDQKIEDR
jgi:hypothetical protein